MSSRTPLILVIPVMYGVGNSSRYEVFAMLVVAFRRCPRNVGSSGAHASSIWRELLPTGHRGGAGRGAAVNSAAVPRQGELLVEEGGAA